MKDAVELHGCLVGEHQTFNLVPSGNHRNQQRVQIQPGQAGQPGPKCPKCRGALRAWVQTFPTPLYETWRDEAATAILAKYQPGQFDGPVVVFAWIFGGKGFMESRDWDNVQKCVGDVLASCGVLPLAGSSSKVAKADDALGGGDDVRSIKGWRTWYLDRAEHAALTGQKADSLQSRLFIQLVPASKVADPFRL